MQGFFYFKRKKPSFYLKSKEGYVHVWIQKIFPGEGGGATVILMSDGGVPKHFLKLNAI